MNFLSFPILDSSQEAAAVAEALVESEHHDWSLHPQVVLPVLPGPAPVQRVGAGVGPLPAGGGVHHVRHRLHHTQVHGTPYSGTPYGIMVHHTRVYGGSVVVFSAQ